VASPPRPRSSRSSSSTKGKSGGKSKGNTKARTASKPNRKTTSKRSRSKKRSGLWSHPALLATALMALFLAVLGLGGTWLGLWKDPEAAPAPAPIVAAAPERAEPQVQPLPRPKAPQVTEQAMAYQGHVYEETPLPGVRMTDPPVTDRPATDLHATSQDGAPVTGTLPPAPAAKPMHQQPTAPVAAPPSPPSASNPSQRRRSKPLRCRPQLGSRTLCPPLRPRARRWSLW
jgi:hypothetical protein